MKKILLTLLTITLLFTSCKKEEIEVKEIKQLNYRFALSISNYPLVFPPVVNNNFELKTDVNGVSYYKNFPGQEDDYSFYNFTSIVNAPIVKSGDRVRVQINYKADYKLLIYITNFINEQTFEINQENSEIINDIVLLPTNDSILTKNYTFIIK